MEEAGKSRSVPEETKKVKLKKVFTLDCMSLGKRILEEFREYVANANDEAFYALIKR